MRWMRSAAFATLCLLAGPAFAETSVFYTAGAWSAFSGTADNGKNVCGMSESGADRWFAVKYFQGESRFTVHLAKAGWHIPSGTQARVDLRFDGGAPWHATAGGFTLPNGLSALEFYVAGEGIVKFGNEFRLARQMVVSFPDGDEIAWAGKLTGSEAALTAFTGCLSRLVRPGAPGGDNDTQPFAKTLPSQPFRTPQPVAPVLDRPGFQNL